MNMIGIIVNPLSGDGRGSNIWKEIQTYLQLNNIPHIARVTTKPGEATPFAMTLVQEERVDKLIVIGGDGTIHEVAKLTNEASYKKILNRIGLGKLSYFISILRVFATYQPCTAWLEVDGTVHELPNMWLAAVANIPFYGGSIQICPAASPHDGIADIVVIQSRGRFRLLPILFTVYQGKHIRHPAVSFYQGTSMTLRTHTPLLVQADGEFAGSTPLHIEIVPSAITVIGSSSIV